jgi:hypothetical protein
LIGLLQRVNQASVEVGGREIARIGPDSSFSSASSGATTTTRNAC